MSYDPATYNQQERTVTVKGEVFFDVTHNPEKPFKVQAGEVSTTVLGTAFNVEAYPGENNTRVTLVRGKLRINTASNLFILSPGQRMTYNLEKKSMDVSNVETERTADWINGQLVFNDLLLTDVFKRLETVYNIRIVTRGITGLNTKHLTGTYEKRDPETIIKKISFIYDLKYTKQGDEFIVTL